MFVGLSAPFVAGESVPATLVFEQRGRDRGELRGRGAGGGGRAGRARHGDAGDEGGRRRRLRRLDAGGALPLVRGNESDRGERMTRAFVFPGQGAQVVGMGRDLAVAYPAARAVFDEVDEALGREAVGAGLGGRRRRS